MGLYHKVNLDSSRKETTKSSTQDAGEEFGWIPTSGLTQVAEEEFLWNSAVRF